MCNNTKYYYTIFLKELFFVASLLKITYMKFSQRIGITPVAKAIQINSMDNELRNQLWSLIYLCFIKAFDKSVRDRNISGEYQLYQLLWYKFFKYPVDSIPRYSEETQSAIREEFFKFEWFQVYDFIDFLAKTKFQQVNYEEFRLNVNGVLERESSAYRFIDDIICPITNEIEINTIEESFELTKEYTALEGANIHLNSALEKLSDKKSPDYRNSIKESISAVEATCRQLTDQSTLGKALKKLQSNGIYINEQLKDGFEQIYAYTNSKESGIRHSIIDEHKEPDIEDAKFLLVASSAFINYLIGKCNL